MPPLDAPKLIGAGLAALAAFYVVARVMLVGLAKLGLAVFERTFRRWLDKLDAMPSREEWAEQKASIDRCETMLASYPKADRVEFHLSRGHEHESAIRANGKDIHDLMQDRDDHEGRIRVLEQREIRR